jgi:cell division protein FtsW
MVLLLIAGIRFREVLKISLVAAVFGLAIIFTIGRGGVVVDRVTRGLSFGKKAKTEQGVMGKYDDSERSQMAIYNGGIFGVGAGRSIMRARLTHPESDYLFAIVVEEFGLLLSLMIIMLYLWLFFRAFRIFERCEWLYAGLLEVGLALLVTSQGFMHIAVNIGLMIETGQNLPFLTQGRTSMFCASIAVGLMLSISRQAELGTLVPSSQKEENKQL